VDAAAQITEWDEVLVDGLTAAAASFETNELSYLALTSGAEHVVRHRLAWALSKRCFRVAREWRRRVDLAVLDDKVEPLSALEAKATYTHDTTWGMSKTRLEKHRLVGGAKPLETEIRWDARKVSREAGPGRSYTLLIAMHRHDRVPAQLRGLIKQSRRAPREWDKAEQQLLEYLRPLGDISHGILLGDGSAFDIRSRVSGTCRPGP
jgi:hypothetical protein